MKRFLTVAVSCVICTMLALGVTKSPKHQIPKEFLPSNGISIREVSQEFTEGDMGNKANSVYFANKYKNPKKEATEAPLVKVRANFPALGEEWEMRSFIIYNHEGTVYDVIVEQDYDENGRPIPINKWEFEIPEGVYDCMAVFKRINPELYWGTEAPVHYIVENIKVKESVKIELKPQDSVICLNMQPTIPNGELCRFMKVDWWEDGFTTIDEGNVGIVEMIKMVYFRGQLIECVFTIPWSLDLVPGTFGAHDPYSYQNIYVNLASDNYLFRTVHLMTSGADQEEGVYAAVTEAKGTVEGKYTNGLYTFEFSEILNTLQSKDYPPIGSEDEPAEPYGISFFIPDFDTNSYGFQSSSSGIWKIWNSRPENPINKDDLYYSYERQLDDMDDPCNEDPFLRKKKIDGTRIYPFASEGKNLIYFPMYPLNMTPDYGFQQDCFYPGAKGFVADFSNCNIYEGGTAPLLTSYVENTFDWESEKNYKTFGFDYSGRLGEKIESDKFLSASSLSVDGKEVASGSDNIKYWMIENPDKDGKYTVEVSTDNFEIDGIRGGNKATVTFDFSKEDKLPPSVTMLQFSNNEGTLTQNFVSPEYGILKLSAADFEIVTGNKMNSGFIPSWFEVTAPERITALCSPTGSVAEAYNEIKLTENPDFFYTPGLGAFYSGSLSDITLKSATGWFDLTLIVEDAAGNSQTQTISPAFHIDSMTGIDMVTPSDRVRVVGNSIKAPEGSRVFSTNGIEINSSGVAPGIYLVKTPTGVVKVAVK